MAPTIERIDSGCASNLMRVLIRLTAPLTAHALLCNAIIQGLIYLTSIIQLIVYVITNQIIRDVAKEQNVFLIDLDRKLNSSKNFLSDSVHLNENGSILVLRFISESLARAFPDEIALVK